MKQLKETAGARRKLFADRANGAAGKNGAADDLASAAVFSHPKTAFEATSQRYVDLFHFAPVAYVSFDRVGRIEEINLAATQLLDRSRDQLMGEPFALHVMKKDSALFLNHLFRCRSSDSRVETELRLKKRNGEIILARLDSSPTTSSMRDGVLLYQTAIVDLTEQKRVEEAIRESEERYRTLFNLDPMAVYTIDTSGVIRDFNHRAAELWGREPELGDTDQRFCGSLKMFRQDGSFMPHDQCPMAEVVSGKISAVHNAEVLIERPDGSHVTVLVNIRPLKNDRGEVTGAINCFYDITERKKAEAALQRSRDLLEQLVEHRTKALRIANAELREEIARRKGLEGQILEVSDREQQRLSQELHDGLCQHLTAIAFMARATATRLRNHRVFEVDDIEKIGELVNGAAADARNIARALHRLDVDSAGLLNALQDLVDREIWKTPCRLEIAEAFDIQNDRAASHLYRIAREAVINANKHAQAREIVVHLGRSRKGILLSISDDGVGMPQSTVGKGGLGLHFMNYRAQAAGGRIKVERLPNGGTCVSCFLPAGTRGNQTGKARSQGNSARTSAKR